MAATVDTTVDLSVDVDALLDAPLPDLMARAAARRDAVHGNRITFSPKVFIPLTMLCRDKCGYCTFAKPPAHLVSPYLELDEVLAIARRGAELGCHEALFTLGEAPEDRYPDAAAWLAARGYSSTVDYLVAAAAAVLAETGLLPHANAGALTEDELTRLRAVSPSQGMMIETLAERLGEPGGPHAGAPDKTPARRLATLEAAGRARVPFTTGILVGIGETRQERLDALLAIQAAHERHGHVQEVIVQNFLPKTGTSMWRSPACPPDEFLWTIAVARLVLDPSIHLQAPPNLSDADDLAALVAAGIDDWGGVSPVTPDHVNPERPWPALELLRDATEATGHTLAPRLTVYPEYVRDGDRWLHDDVRFAVRCASDLEGLARDDAWSAGGDVAPPLLLPAPLPAGWTGRARTPVGEVLDGVLAGEEVGVDEIVTLLEARGPDFLEVAAVADQLRIDAVGDPVTFVRNRNINYTNVCTFKCKFCAFSKGPLSLNLRGTPYLLDLEEIQRRVLEAVDCGATEVCLQGGIHPELRRQLLPLRGAGGEGGRAADPRARLHRARGHRRRAPARHAVPRLPGAGQGRRSGDPARHRGRDPRRRGAGDHLPRQDRHRGVARRPPHRALGRVALEHHDHVRQRRTTRARRPPPRPHPCGAEGDRRLHRVRAAAVRAHGHADLPAEEVAQGSDHA